MNIGTPKTKTSNRTLKLSEDIMVIVKRYREHQNNEKIVIGSKWIETDRLFTTWNGQPMQNGCSMRTFQPN